MLIISIRDNEKKNRWNRKSIKKKDRKEQRAEASYSESVRAKWICRAFK